MIKINREKKASTRESIWYPQSKKRAAKQQERFINRHEIHMFIDDLKNHLIPLPSRNRTKIVDIKLDIEDTEIIRKVSNALNNHDRDLHDALWHFISNNGYNLISDYELNVEIVYKDNGKFSFEYIAPYSIIKICSKVYQYIPRKVSKTNFPNIIALNPDNIFTIKLSPNNKSQIKKTIRMLENLSNDIMPKYIQNYFEKEKKFHPAFDTSSYNRENCESIASATKQTGWAGRSLFDKNTLEYYRWIRRLRFEELSNNIRKDLVKGLNLGLQKVKSSWICPKIIIPDVADKISIAYKEFYKGEKTFAEILNPILD